MSDFVKWEEKYLVGIDEIDAQHKKLIELYNKFIQARKEHNEHEILREVLMELVDYTKYHFSTEEKFMTKYNYPVLPKHKEQHNVLIKQITDLILNVNYNEEKAVVTLEVMLKNWILKHILTMDKAFGEYVKREMGGQGN